MWSCTAMSQREGFFHCLWDFWCSDDATCLKNWTWSFINRDYRWRWMPDLVAQLCKTVKTPEFGKLANRQQFSMVCTLIEHRNDVKLFKTQVEGEWIRCKVLNILTSFPCWTRQNCCRFVFYNNIDNFWRPLPFKWKPNCACFSINQRTKSFRYCKMLNLWL